MSGGQDYGGQVWEGLSKTICGNPGGLPHLEVMSPSIRLGASRSSLDGVQQPPYQVATKVYFQEAAHGQGLLGKELFHRHCPRKVYLFSLRISLGYGVPTGLSVGAGQRCTVTGFNHGAAHAVAVDIRNKYRSESREQFKGI